MQYCFNVLKTIKQSNWKGGSEMVLIIKDDKGNVIVEKELEGSEYVVDLTQSPSGQVQCSIQQTIASIH